MGADLEVEGYGKWIVVTRRLQGEKTDGGIFIPETARSRMEPEYAGTVVSIGDEVGGSLKTGDRIIYSHCFPMARQSTKEVVYALVHKDQVLGRVHNEDLIPTSPPTQMGLRQS